MYDLEKNLTIPAFDYGAVKLSQLWRLLFLFVSTSIVEIKHL